jgi:Uma2 family endonuclease
MATLIQDAELSQKLIAERKRTGLDRWDEVWEGVYVMNPLANDEHQEFVSHLTYVLETVVWEAKLGKVRPGVNVSDREKDWERNYRCPHVVVFLNETKAINHGTYWLGGPDFAVEIASPGDRSREKLDFYAKVCTRELLLLDRNPWSLELYRHDGGRLVNVGTSTPGQPSRLTSEVQPDRLTGEVQPDWLTSKVVPLTFRLVPGAARPEIEVVHPGTGRNWRF